jgi:carbon storage regulator
MLVLTRKSGESLIIGEEVVVTVVEVRGGQVKIGIEAPPEIYVYRKELLEKIKRQNLDAAKSDKAYLNSLAKLVKSRAAKK